MYNPTVPFDVDPYQEGDNGTAIHLTPAPAPRHRANRPSRAFRAAFRVTEAIGGATDFVVGMSDRMGRGRALLLLMLGAALGVAVGADVLGRWV